MKITFKKGDMVHSERYSKDCIFVGLNGEGRGIVEHISNHGWSRDDDVPSDWVSKGSNKYWFISEGEDWVLLKPAEVVKISSQKVNFILQYELDEDPFETFATRKEVDARIQELALRDDLKKDSIKVYEVSRTWGITLQTKVVYNGLLDEEGELDLVVVPTLGKRVHKPHKKHVFKKKCPDCDFRAINKGSLGQHRRHHHKEVAVHINKIGN